MTFLLPLALDWNDINSSIEYSIQEGEEIQFLCNNHGSGNIFPEGTVHNFKEKSVPSFITFSEGDGINRLILTEVSKHLVDHEIIKDDRVIGYTPFVLLDGHQSCFELEFLSCINDSSYKWNICIGVPYGTSLW